MTRFSELRHFLPSDSLFQVPASERLDFMRKFSLYPYSMRLGIATDLWAEVAVLVMARQEIMKMIAVIKVATIQTYNTPTFSLCF